VIALLPSFRETLVLPRSARDIGERLSASTSHKPFLQPDEAELLFSGWVKPDRFRIALRIRRPNHFIPLVIGTIDSTSSGCLVVLSYQLFPLTQILLYGWTCFLLLGGAIGIIFFNNYPSALGVAVVLALIHSIARSNFNLQLRLTRDALHRVVA
jgi:hypothetical protein